MSLCTTQVQVAEHGESTGLRWTIKLGNGSIRGLYSEVDRIAGEKPSNYYRRRQAAVLLHYHKVPKNIILENH